MRPARLAILRTWCVAGVLACAGNAGCARPAGERFALAPGDLWIRGVTVVSMERDEPLPHTHVVVRDGRIAWVGVEPGEATGVTIIDGAARYLVPGLIDAHVHLGASLPGMPAAHQAALPDLVKAYTEQVPRSYLSFGFTTLVELGVTDREALERVRSADPAPRVVDCGGALVVANGYPMRLGRADGRFEQYPNVLYDPAQQDSLPAGVNAADHSPGAAVDRVRAGGGRCLKAFYELGPPDHPWPVPTDAMMREARDAGRRAGLPLLLHANSLAAHRFAASVAPAAVAHGLWMWPGLLTEPWRGGQLPAEVRGVLDAERDAGVAYMPTLRVIGGLVDLADPAFLDQPLLARALPAALIAWYRSPEAREAAAESNPGGPMHELLRSASALGTLALAHMSLNGGRILFGSDTPSDSIYTNPPGFNGYLELLAMERAGLAPRQVVAAATIENARLLGLDGEIGTVEAGKQADLLLLGADPLASIGAFAAIETVILRGRALPRADLDARRVEGGR